MIVLVGALRVTAASGDQERGDSEDGGSLSDASRPGYEHVCGLQSFPRRREQGIRNDPRNASWSLLSCRFRSSTRSTRPVATTDPACGHTSLPDGTLGTMLWSLDLLIVMPKTIVWASDGSESATRALPHATALLDGDGALLIAVHIAPERSAGEESCSAAEGDGRDLVDELRDTVTNVTERGIKAILRVVNFPGMQPAQAMANIATGVGADMIVVGTRGHSPIEGALVGSVAQRLLQLAPCPVLAVPPSAVPPGQALGSDAVAGPVRPHLRRHSRTAPGSRVAGTALPDYGSSVVLGRQPRATADAG